MAEEQLTDSKQSKRRTPNAPPLDRTAALQILQQAFFECQQAGIEMVVNNGAYSPLEGNPTPPPALTIILPRVILDSEGSLRFA